MNLALITGKNPIIDSSFGVLEMALAYVSRVCVFDVTSPSGGANISFAVPHTLGVTPQFVIGTPFTAGNTVGHTDAELAAWSTTHITLHASAASKKFRLIVGTVT